MVHHRAVSSFRGNGNSATHTLTSEAGRGHFSQGMPASVPGSARLVQA